MPPKNSQLGSKNIQWSLNERVLAGKPTARPDLFTQSCCLCRPTLHQVPVSRLGSYLLTQLIRTAACKGRLGEAIPTQSAGEVTKAGERVAACKPSAPGSSSSGAGRKGHVGHFFWGICLGARVSPLAGPGSWQQRRHGIPEQNFLLSSSCQVILFLPAGCKHSLYSSSREGNLGICFTTSKVNKRLGS